MASRSCLSSMSAMLVHRRGCLRGYLDSDAGPVSGCDLRVSGVYLLISGQKVAERNLRKCPPNPHIAPVRCYSWGMEMNTTRPEEVTKMDFTDYTTEAIDLATSTHEQVSRLLDAASTLMPAGPTAHHIDAEAWDAAAFGYFSNLSDDPSHFGVTTARHIAAAAEDYANDTWHEYTVEG